MPSPHAQPREDGLAIYATENGHAVRVQVGKLALTIEGCADEAAAVATATLDALAARRGKRPARDRTARRLIEALGAP